MAAGCSLMLAASPSPLALARERASWQLSCEQAPVERPVSPVPLLPSEDWWAFDTTAVRPSDVLLIFGPAASSPRFPSSAVYWLYYVGSTDGRFGSAFPAADAPAPPGLAISINQDGRNWTHIVGDHHTGALLGFGEEPRGWEARCIAAAMVVRHPDGNLRM
ncbi:uncharacterized protein C2845_PM02G13140 [Panicum miliaceum]|uniref:Uncharacterized protein n=1 Tax=Panicum miliaceum TaxID=4540 RepID=A0A3L6SDA2_PANMI|nr:uncharacterized protein C2845_PM02G13140 [Panicum miliaceum]